MYILHFMNQQVPSHRSARIFKCQVGTSKELYLNIFFQMFMTTFSNCFTFLLLCVPIYRQRYLCVNMFSVLIMTHLPSHPHPPPTPRILLHQLLRL